MKSIREYPNATKITIPLSAVVARTFFYLPNPFFKGIDFLQRWADDLNRETMLMKTWTQIHIAQSDETVFWGNPAGRYTTQLTLYEEEWSAEKRRRTIATIHGEINGTDRRMIITLLVPVPSMHKRSVDFIDTFRNYAAGNSSYFAAVADVVDPKTRSVMKSLREMDAMEKVLVSKGLAPDAAHDQAVKALMPMDLQRLLRPDSLGGSPADREVANERLQDARRALQKSRGGRRKTRKSKH